MTRAAPPAGKTRWAPTSASPAPTTTSTSRSTPKKRRKHRSSTTRDDPSSRGEKSVRGCFLDEIYAKPRLEQKLADLYFDGDVPYMRDNVHLCRTRSGGASSRVIS